ncbi:MAG: carbon monoxide dehydrogenase [Candidatus Eisenbacteria sp.]|nr:carbon monoxide dehydrogenase [Candidatus Eisenbacteria bacterium]
MDECNLARAVARGAAARADHARALAQALLKVARDRDGECVLGNEERIRRLAVEMGISAEGAVAEVAEGVARAVMSEFERKDGELVSACRAPENRQKVWRNAGVFPRGVDLDIRDVLDSTGKKAGDARDFLWDVVRCALADGWGGSMLAGDISGVLFSPLWPARVRMDLGVLKESNVNIVIHGHEPGFVETVVRIAAEPDMLGRAKIAGAQGIAVIATDGISNEALIRDGLPVTGNLLQQELLVATGAVDLLAVDERCALPDLQVATRCCHTRLVAVSSGSGASGPCWAPSWETFDSGSSRELIAGAIGNFGARDQSRVEIPNGETGLIGGFTAESLSHHFGGRFRGGFRLLNDAVAAGRIRGIAALMSSNLMERTLAEGILSAVTGLLSKDVLVVQTGPALITCAAAGLLRPEAASEFAGDGLREVCEMVGIPPVLHMGSCAGHSEVLLSFAGMVMEGGVGKDLSQLPVAAVMPEVMSDDAAPIAVSAAASGVPVIAVSLPGEESRKTMDFLSREMPDALGGTVAFVGDPGEAVSLVLEHLDERRSALNLKPSREAAG